MLTNSSSNITLKPKKYVYKKQDCVGDEKNANTVNAKREQLSNESQQRTSGENYHLGYQEGKLGVAVYVKAAKLN